MENKMFSLNRSFVRELAELFYDDQISLVAALNENRLDNRKPKGGYKVRKPVSKKRIEGHIKELIEVSYWGSLTKEEGRNHDFEIVYALPEQASVGSNYVTIDPRLSFDSQILAKLAPALESTQRIAVCKKASRKNQLEIWGIAPPFEWPSLRVTAIGPGQLIVWISDMWKARISEKAQLVDVGRYDDLFSSVQPTYPIQDEADKVAKENSRPDLEKIAIAMRAHGHGGILLIIPDSITAWRNVIDMGKFRFSPYEKFKKDLEKRDEAVRQFVSGHTVEHLDTSFKSMAQSIKSIAQFTAVDGATLITPDRVLLGFGAKIRPTKKKDERYELVISDPFYPGEVENVNLSELPWGTRHKAAARFAFDQKGTVAVVASVDGRLSVFKRNGRKLFVLRNAEFLWL